MPLMGACKTLMNPCPFLFCLVNVPGTETGLRISPSINFWIGIIIPRLSNVFCVNGRLVSPDEDVSTKDLSVPDNLLYCPAGSSQVAIAERMITTIKIGIGPGNDLLFDIVKFFFSTCCDCTAFITYFIRLYFFNTSITSLCGNAYDLLPLIPTIVSAATIA